MNNDLLVAGMAWSFVQIVRAMPALIWSIRCRPSSNAYRCPPVFPAQRNDRRKTTGGSSRRSHTTCHLLRFLRKLVINCLLILDS